MVSKSHVNRKIVASQRHSILLLASLVLLIVLSASLVPVPAHATTSRDLASNQAAISTGTYKNPLKPQTLDGSIVESCADPSIIQGQDNYWYIYCTTDPLNDDDRNEQGHLNFHLVPILQSFDLVHWNYVGDAFSERPSWAEPTAGIWAPEIHYRNGLYYLYFTVTDVKPEVSGEQGCPFDNAIGVATAPTPVGPWLYQDTPVVEPRRGGPGCNFFWTFDPDVIRADDGQSYIYYGSYYGGIQVRELSEDGSTAPAATAVQITIPNRYEGSVVFKYGDHYYLFASATNCCNGPLTGYSVFAGRSSSPTGPFVDREGVPLLSGRVGGTPVLSMNGNRWVGLGHNDVFSDVNGQTWTVYHAVDRFDPYFENSVGFTKRPVLLDALDWVDGWPSVRSGRWASDTPQHAPAAQPESTSQYKPKAVQPQVPGQLIGSLSDEFDANTLNPQWSWVREPSASSHGLGDGTFRFATQAADLFVDSNSASVLIQDAPDGNYVVETKVNLDLPAEGCCHNFVQAGLVLYGDDDNYLKLVHVSIWETRQTEFAKELSPVPAGFPRYGNTVVGSPEQWTYLRIVRQMRAGEEQYTAYSSHDGLTWVRGGTWTHQLGENAYIGLVSMGGSGFTAHFDYIRVYKLHH